MAEINIRRATEQDIDTLVELWIESFHDPEDYIRLFYRRNIDRMEIWILELDGEVASMSNLLPAMIVDGERKQKAWMGYAGCVKKTFRGHGLWKMFQEKLIKHLEEQDAAFFFKPAIGLDTYYEEMGFSVDSRWSVIEIKPKGYLQEVSFMPVSSEEFYRIREETYYNRPFIRWSEQHLSWAIEDSIYWGGNAEKLKFSGKEYFILTLKKGDDLIIQETTLPKETLEELSLSIAAHYGAKKIILHTEYCSNQWPMVISSMSMNNHIINPYVNIMLI